jgi:hypothetical protein
MGKKRIVKKAEGEATEGHQRPRRLRLPQQKAF